MIKMFTGTIEQYAEYLQAQQKKEQKQHEVNALTQEELMDAITEQAGIIELYKARHSSDDPKEFAALDNLARKKQSTLLHKLVHIYNTRYEAEVDDVCLEYVGNVNATVSIEKEMKRS